MQTKTLRDEFAMAALTSVACAVLAEANYGQGPHSLAATAYDIADAMLEARESTRETDHE